jgi:glucose dehydrogenase
VGGTNWQSPSFDPATGWLYVVARDGAQRYVSTEDKYEPGRQYWGGRGSPTDDPGTSGIRAIDSATGEVKWEYLVSRPSYAAGVLATAGGVLFAATGEGNLIALDSKTGAYLWRFQTGGTIASSPMSYSVDGTQYVALSAGNVLYTFALPE